MHARLVVPHTTEAFRPASLRSACVSSARARPREDLMRACRHRSLMLFARVALLVAAIAASIGRSPVIAQSATQQLQLSPQDTTLNLNATNYSSNGLLMAFTWPDNQVANTILMKFDFSAVPAGAVVQRA